MKKNNFNSVIKIFVVIILMGCGSSENDFTKMRTKQLQNIIEYGVLPLHVDFKNACEALYKQSIVFEKELTVGNLKILQQQWVLVGKLYKRCQLYDIGEVKGSFIHPRIYRWPVNETRINDTIKLSNNLTLNNISNMGSNLVGLGCLEYLLFDNDKETVLNNFNNNLQRIKLLTLVSEYLFLNSVELNLTWVQYSSNFEHAIERKIGGGQNQIANSLVSYLEQMVKMSLGKALGENNGGKVDFRLLEAYKSDASLDFLKSGFSEWKSCFYGDFKNSRNNYGFDDYLIEMDNKKLAIRIENTIKDCELALANLKSLNQDLNTHPEKVSTLKKKFNELTVFIKTDLSSFIGATITVNDSDGD